MPIKNQTTAFRELHQWPRVSTKPAGRLCSTLLCVEYNPSKNVTNISSCHILSGSLLYVDRSYGRRGWQQCSETFKASSYLDLFCIMMLTPPSPIHSLTHGLCRPSSLQSVFFHYVVGLLNTAYYTRYTVLPGHVSTATQLIIKKAYTKAACGDGSHMLVRSHPINSKWLYSTLRHGPQEDQ